MSPKIGILDGGSLFSEGIIRSFQRSYPSTSIEVIDLSAPGSLGKVSLCSLDIVVLVQEDPERALQLRNQLFEQFPHLKVIIVEPNSDQARVVQWSVHPAYQVGDIFKMIHSLGQEDQNIQTDTL